MNQHNRKAAVPATPVAGTAVSTSPAPHPLRLAVAQAPVLVVQTSAKQYRRSVFLTLAAAEPAEHKAEAKRHDAHVMLCCLVHGADRYPVGGDAL
ncbi:hypothetical protein GCM10009767_35710 [Kocuria aegyptia]|uniref:Uncharacterized protein n=1 Tax=Kocuria aegyptia TaxID=330943 RepID=A0ABP4XDR7_9MICC